MPQRNHEQLFDIAKRMPTDLQPYGHRAPTANGVTQLDCSCNCKFFIRLADGAGFDWGVCVHLQSLRAGLLTYEHFGCPLFELLESDEYDVADPEYSLAATDVQ